MHRIPLAFTLRPCLTRFVGQVTPNEGRTTRPAAPPPRIRSNVVNCRTRMSYVTTAEHIEAQHLELTGVLLPKRLE